MYRLTSETITEGERVTSYTYAYDNVSNRILKTENGAATEYVYNALNQLVSDSETSYEYDLNGNLVRVIGSAQSALYEYNSENKLVRATVQNGVLVTEESYTYDYEGNRTSKTTHKSNGEFEYTKYLNDNSSLTNVLVEIDENGTVKCVYTIGADLISQERDGKVSVYLYDGHGSFVGLANESGVVTDTYSYDAFGNLLKTKGSTENCYRYCGEQFDESTGLYYLRARYMDTSTGRFISQDSYAGSISDPVSLHKYLYANADPVNNSDPSGYMTFVGAIVASAICGILVSMATTYLSNVFAIRDQTGEFDWSWNLTVDDVCMSVLVGGGLGALGAIALMCQFVVATSILIASAAGFGIYNLYECVENANAGNISTAIFQGTLAILSFLGSFQMSQAMGNFAGNNYSPANPGPLPDEIANTFEGGSYTKTILTEDTTFYRVYGGEAGKIGRYVSRTPQNGGMQSQFDLALNPDWGNTAECVVEVKIPKGTVVYEEYAAPQIINGGAGYLYGGGSQVYIPEVDAIWFGQ